MDLQNIFTMVINMTVTASIVILCVLAARLVLKKAPRVLSCALWLVVLLRLLCPVSVSGPVSVLGLVDAPMAASGMAEFVELPVRSPTETIRVDPDALTAGQATQIAPVRAPIDWNFYGSRVWIAVTALLLGYGILSYVNLKRKLRESVPIGKGVRECDGIASPFVLGRTIYLPAGLRPEERGYILLHEQLHIRHGDPVVKTLFWLAVCIHWFNPLVWLAFFLCGRDMELRCDEAVLKQLGSQVQSDYAQSLLDLAMGRRFAPAPLAFGEGDTGKRVKFVLKWKKSKLRIAVPAAVLCAAVIVLTACDPAKAKDSPFGHSYQAVSSYASVSDFSFPLNTYYTLTSDMCLFIRGEKTEQVGFFQEVPANADSLKDFPESFRRLIRRCWHIEESGWWLMEHKNGDLQLHDLNQSVVHTLARTDLLGVTIRQPGIEAYVEPVWYATDSWAWMPEEMSATLVDSDARIVLMPEQEVDMLLVSEEYYQRQPDGETSITVSDYFLERDAKGEFALEVSRRGDAGDDFAVYQVTVGEDRYAFRLTFPMVPGETSVAVGVPEQWREVRYEEHGAFITLQLPESWSYAVTSIDDEALDAGIAGGITFWPLGREDGKLFFGFYPDRFAVCGTGLETAELVLAGQTATVGTYDDRPLWDFISFGEYFAVWGQNHEAWWSEYGNTAMEILNTAQFGK